MTGSRTSFKGKRNTCGSPPLEEKKKEGNGRWRGREKGIEMANL